MPSMAAPIAFEGLFNMEVSKKYGPISVATMIDLAYSTDCCHVINATTDEQLGRFYAENDFIPALEKVPDSIFEYLDFEMLGRKARFEEGGVFASGGYVIEAMGTKDGVVKTELEGRGWTHWLQIEYINYD